MPSINFKKMISPLKERISENNDITEEDTELLFEFERDLRIKDYSYARIYKLLNTLLLIGERNGFELNNANKEDIKDIVAWVNSRDLSDETKRDYKVILKRFYRWFTEERCH